MSDGSLVEAVIDRYTNAYARSYSGSSWSGWWELGTSVTDVSVTPAGTASPGAALVSVVFNRSKGDQSGLNVASGLPGDRGIYSFTAGGGPAATSL